MKLPKFKNASIVIVKLEPKDGMIKQTFGIAHYSWWRTKDFNKGIRISARLLDAFLTGKADLRQLFLQPENEREYYDVVFQSGEYRKTLSDEKTLPEDKLPTAGYVLPEDARESIVISLPMKDRNLLTELVRKFGWACM